MRHRVTLVGPAFNGVLHLIAADVGFFVNPEAAPLCQSIREA